MRENGSVSIVVHRSARHKFSKDNYKRERGKLPTPGQLASLIYLEQTGSIKGTSQVMKKSAKTIEYHLAMLRARAGVDSLYSLIGWGFRNGYLK